MIKEYPHHAVELLAVIGELAQETIREGKAPRFIHLNASERGAIAPFVTPCSPPGARREFKVLGMKVRHSVGGAYVSD